MFVTFKGLTTTLQQQQQEQRQNTFICLHFVARRSSIYLQQNRSGQVITVQRSSVNDVIRTFAVG